MQNNKDPSDKTTQSSSDEETDDVRRISKVISQQKANLILKNEGETIESKQRYL